MKYVALVMCSDAKMQTQGQAKQVYRGKLARKSLSWAASNCDHAFFLSASLGLVDPNEVIQPYNLSIRTLSSVQKKLWSLSVVSSLVSVFPDSHNYRLLALTSKHYTSPLRGIAEAVGFSWYSPFTNLGIWKMFEMLDHPLCEVLVMSGYKNL